MKCNAWIKSVRVAAASAAALALWGSAAQAQSLFSNRGLGLVVEPADARATGLGGVELGLAESDFSWTNPAELIGLPAPGMRLAFQYDEFTSTFGDRAVEGSTARFPLIQLATPVGEKWALSLGFGGFLDQNYAIERDTTLLIGTDSSTVRDRLTSEGGVVRLRVGAAYRIVPTLSVGIGADMYAGAVQRRFGRQFGDEAPPSCCRAEWRYTGFGALAGVAWTPSEATSLSLAATYGGTLEAESQDSLAAGSSYTLPATVHAGGSARVAPSVRAAASGSWSRWSSLDAQLAGVGGARDAWSVQGGLEWDAIELRDRPLPIRLGARQAALPFSWSQAAGTADWATERALTTGLGLVLAGGATIADVALERGWRGGEAAGLDESFWRVVFSVSVLGR